MAIRMTCHNLLRLFILSTCLSSTISGYAIGIDLGDHKSVISSVCKKGVRVLTNKIGGRSTPSVGVYLDNERKCGENTAGGVLTRNLDRAVFHPRKMISENHHILKNIPLDEHTKVDLDPASQIASILYHLLEAGRSNLYELDKSLDCQHPGCIVSSVPAQFLSSQKRVLENALTIACTTENFIKTIKEKNQKSEHAPNYHLPHIGLLTDGAAVAFTYGFDRRNEIASEMKLAQEMLTPQKEENKTKDEMKNKVIASGRTVCFVDFGYSGLQVTVAKITDIGATVIAHTGDSTVSGNKLDHILFHLAIDKLIETGIWSKDTLLPRNHLNKHFEEYHSSQELPGDVSDDAVENDGLLMRKDGVLTKAGIRLFDACMKAKVTLSANPVASVMVECLDGEKDARLAFTRDEFEKSMSEQSIPQRLKTSCREALKLAQVGPGTLHSVELLGGISYIPSFRDLVGSTMAPFSPMYEGVRQTMDPLDSVARGCALSAASVLSRSPHEQSRGRVMIPYFITDCSAYPLKVQSYVTDDTKKTSPNKPTANIINTLLGSQNDKPVELSAQEAANQDEEKEMPFTVQRCIPAGEMLPLTLPVEFGNLPPGSSSAVVDVFEDEQCSAFGLQFTNSPSEEKKNLDWVRKQRLVPKTDSDLFLGRFHLEPLTVGPRLGDEFGAKKKTPHTRVDVIEGKMKTEVTMDSRGHVDLGPLSSFDWSEITEAAPIKSETKEGKKTTPSTATTTSTAEAPKLPKPNNRIFKSIPLTVATVKLASMPTVTCSNPGATHYQHELIKTNKDSNYNKKLKLFQIKNKHIIHDNDKNIMKKITHLIKNKNFPNSPMIKQPILLNKVLESKLILESNFRDKDYKLFSVTSALNALEESIYEVKNLLLTNQAYELNPEYYDELLHSKNKITTILDNESKQIERNWSFQLESLLENNAKNDINYPIYSYLTLKEQAELFKYSQFASRWLEEQPIDSFSERDISEHIDQVNAEMESVEKAFDVQTDNVQDVVSTSSETEINHAKNDEGDKSFINTNLVIKRLSTIENFADSLNSKMLFRVVDAKDRKESLLTLKAKLKQLKQLFEKVSSFGQEEVEDNEEETEIRASIAQQIVATINWFKSDFVTKIAGYTLDNAPSEEEFKSLASSIDEKRAKLNDKFKLLADTIELNNIRDEDMKRREEEAKLEDKEQPSEEAMLYGEEGTSSNATSNEPPPAPYHFDFDFGTAGHSNNL